MKKYLEKEKAKGREADQPEASATAFREMALSGHVQGQAV